MCIIVNRRMKRHIFLLLCMVAVVLTGCNNAKLSVANEQYERGEYYDASVTYKKVYNKLRKKEERPLRGQVAYQLATCYRLLNMSTPCGSSLSERPALRIPRQHGTLLSGTVAPPSG